MKAISLPPELLEDMVTHTGATLGSYSHEKPVLLVFLRNFGCTFCRQAMKDISGLKDEIERRGVQLMFVHLADEKTAENYFVKYGLDKYPRISDPETRFYKRFGLLKGTFKQLLGLQVFLRGMQSVMVEGNGITLPIGDGFQMPGIFLITGDQIKIQYIHKYASDRPDYLNLIDCCAGSPAFST